MRKIIIEIGVILLFAFLVMALVSDNPRFYSSNNHVISDLIGQSQYQNLSYKGQNYSLSYVYYNIQANVGDTIQLTVMGNNGEIPAVVFFEQSDGTPIFAYQTDKNFTATYFMTLGNPNVPYYGVTQLPYNEVGSTTYRVQLGVPQQDIVNSTWDNGNLAGAYVKMVTVYSHSLFLSYEVATIIFLIAGVITTIVGLKLKSK